MDNYICINGKKAPLTDEQLHALGLKSELISHWEVSDFYFRPGVTQYDYKCPHCQKTIRSSIKFNDTMFRAHRFCGYCGMQNVFGGV